MKILRLFLGFYLGVAALGASDAQTVISSFPCTISSPGNYVIGANYTAPITMTSGNIITVNASNVTIDFANHSISGPVGASDQTTIGIYAIEQGNVTIKNGTIAYCAQGVHISGNGSSTTNNVGHRIINMRFYYCYVYGVWFNGYAPGSLVSRCQLNQIGGNSASLLSIGFYALGGGVTFACNNIGSVNGPTSSPSASDGMNLDAGCFAIGNIVSNAYNGILGLSYNAKYQNNLTYNCNTPFGGGTDAGGNN